MELNLTILENGNLEISFDESDREGIEEMLSDGHSDLSILLEGTEHYFTNGSYHPFDASHANPFVGLTDATCIAQSLDYDDDGNAIIEGDFWYDAHSAIRNCIEEMLSDGRVIFTLAK